MKTDTVEIRTDAAYATYSFPQNEPAKRFSTSYPIDPIRRPKKSVMSELTSNVTARSFPCRNDLFGFPYTMLNADSSTLKSESDVHPTKSAPITPSVAALSWMERTTLRMPSTELDGNAL